MSRCILLWLLLVQIWEWHTVQINIFHNVTQQAAEIWKLMFILPSIMLKIDYNQAESDGKGHINITF